MSKGSVAYLANRKLHISTDGITQPIESEFERTVRERAASIERRHAWKTQGRGAMFMGGAFAAQNARTDVPVSTTGLAAGEDGALLYSMETDAVSGIFIRDSGGLETRLFHTADFRIRHATLDPAGAMLAATAFHQDSMRSSIAVLPVHGTEFSEVTEGDVFDQFPRWVPGEGRRIVFQSAGIGRDAGGRFAGLGPCSIQEIDLESRSLDEIAAEDGRDLLQPRKAADGSLYFIRKPYESGVRKPSVAGSLKDTVLFPFRMGRALFQYFNLFSMMYSGKPLVTGKGAMQRRMDPRQMFVYGNLAQAHMAQSQEEDGEGLVPSSWELVRRSPRGSAEVIAKKVLAYDLASDGGVLYSDGESITRQDADGHTQQVVKGELIEQILAL